MPRKHIVWVTCPYVKEGQPNPDGSMVNDVHEFDDMANAILYNALAWGLNGSSVHSSRVAQYVSVWFLNSDTAMSPNLNYGQMKRGPTGQNGTHTGILYVGTISWLYRACCVLAFVSGIRATIFGCGASAVRRE